MANLLLTLHVHTAVLPLLQPCSTRMMTEWACLHGQVGLIEEPFCRSDMKN
jgi:hypothetical protein